MYTVGGVVTSAAPATPSLKHFIGNEQIVYRIRMLNPAGA